MAVKTVDRIMARISSHWRLANNIEVTLEANPTSIEAKRFAGYRDAGVNRVSIGVQALNDPDLKALGRLHSANEAIKAVEIGRSIFDRVSFDLIYARQNQSIKDWETELNRAIAFEPDHLSLYQLTIEDGTAFGDRFKRGTLRGLPDEDLGADLWEVTQDLCTQAGLLAYEVSNHAKVGQESTHNQIYWQAGDWAGIGPGAHGRLTLGEVRYETVGARAPAAWIDRVEKIGNGDVLYRPLTPDAVIEERVLMGLRMTNGVEMTKPWINNKIKVINELSDDGLIELDENTLKVTHSGRPLLNAIIQKLLTS